MKPPVPLFFTCTACGHIYSETLQDMVSGRLPLTCPACHRDLSVDWDWINDQAEQMGLISTER